jgi:hypothetical protein
MRLRRGCDDAARAARRGGWELLKITFSSMAAWGGHRGRHEADRLSFLRSSVRTPFPRPAVEPAFFSTSIAAMLSVISAPFSSGARRCDFDSCSSISSFRSLTVMESPRA